MSRAVLLAGGWAHPGDDLVTSVGSLVRPHGFELIVETNPDHAAQTIEAGCDLLIVGACWFAMTDDRYTPQQRADHAVSLGQEMSGALVGLIDAGCPLLALHTAVISFDAGEPWADWLGGTWNWASSWHPEPGPVEVVPAPDSPIEFAPFTVVDELYQGLDVRPDVTMIAQSDSGDPLVWLQQNRGRAAVNLLGHDHRSLDEPAHIELNERLLGWLLEVPSAGGL